MRWKVCLDMLVDPKLQSTLVLSAWSLMCLRRTRRPTRIWFDVILSVLSDWPSDSMVRFVG